MISKEKKGMMMKFSFGMHINIKVFYKLILSWVCIARLAKVSKIRRLDIFAISPEKHG